MKIEVHLQGGLRKIIDITPGATVGATIGKDVRNPDGSLFVPAQPSSPSQVSKTAWELILYIPPNVTALANTATTGLYAITAAGASATREIEPVAGETTVSNGSGVSGNPQVGLADVTPAAGGTLQKYGFDAKGRRTLQEAATTDNLAEGVTNLYFTDERAQDAVGAILTDTADIEWTYGAGSIEANLSDSVHAALADAASALQPGDAIDWTWLTNIPANITAWASISPASKADDSAVVHLAGTETVTGNKTFSGTLTLQGTAYINDAAAGTSRGLRVRTAGVDRWVLGGNTNAESGANAGTDFFINRYSDAGAALGTVMSISRATGEYTLRGNVTWPNNTYTLGGAAARPSTTYTINLDATGVSRFQNGKTSGGAVFGAEVNASTVNNGTGKLFRATLPAFNNSTISPMFIWGAETNNTLSTNVVQIGGTAGGTGFTAATRIIFATGNAVDEVGGVNRWSIDNTGAFWPSAAVYDIGLSSNRVRRLYTQSVDASSDITALGSIAGVVINSSRGATAKGVQLNADATNEYAFIDFNTSNTSSIDYDARISAAGSGSPTTALATLAYTAKEHLFQTRNGAGVSAARWNIRQEGDFRPQLDNAYNIGTASFRVKEYFGVAGAINTSDEREKTAIRQLTEQELRCAAALALLPSIYKWKEAVARKGDGARLHCSPTVQSVIACMESHGLDPFRYGFVCYDQWDEQPEVLDPDTGDVVQEYRPAGDRYSLRPSELQFFIARGQEERLRRLEALLNP